MTVLVKICGINSVEAANAALAARADFGGLVFFPASPRHLGFDQARHIADVLRGKVRVVSLLVNPDDALLSRVMSDIAPDMIQLHGDEPPARVAAIGQICRRPVMKALAIATAEDLRSARRYEQAADYLLFDSRPAPASERPGGVGLAFDWRLLSGIRFDRPWGIAGGLTPENVARAIDIAGPKFVDASSGVEEAPGRKSREKIAAFVSFARGGAITASEA
jgi:phosphoribosylanthranilate isomerase